MMVGHKISLKCTYLGICILNSSKKIFDIFVNCNWVDIDQKQLENVESFKYLSSILTNDGRCTYEI